MTMIDALQLFTPSVEVFMSLTLIFVASYTLFGTIGLGLHLPTATIYDRKRQEFESLHALVREVSIVGELGHLTEMVTRFTSQYVKTDSCWIVFKSEDSEFELISSTGLADNQISNMRFGKNEGALGWICEHKEPLIAYEAAKDERTRHLSSWNRHIRSLVVTPLLLDGEVIGALFAGKNQEFAFDDEDVNLLSAFVSQVSIAMENARLVDRALEKERLEQEMKIAHDVQRSLLPNHLPLVREGVDIAAASIPAAEVGGDYYDYIEISSSHLGIVIGDVSGKGASAAFYMAHIKGIVQALCRKVDSPARLLAEVNRTLYGNMDRRSYISLTLAFFDLDRRRMRFARAGHLPLAHCGGSDGEVRFFAPSGLGLGLDPGPVFDEVIKEEEMKLHEGDIFLLYTDGVPEARNSDREEFGEGRLVGILQRCRSLKAEEIKERLIQEIRNFTGQTTSHDDITMVITKIS